MSQRSAQRSIHAKSATGAGCARLGVRCGGCLPNGRLRLPVNGESIIVPSATHFHCPKCSEVVLRYVDSRQLSENAIAIYRRKHGLLSADEIRALRERLSLTQNELAKLLRLGSNSISRWESGRNVQTEAIELLLRLVRDVPTSIKYLRKRAA